MEANNEKRYQLCIAIDFGTTFSGAAYSYYDNQKEIHVVSHWSDGAVGNKIPTAILFDDRQQFVAFGQNAVDKFTEIEEGDKEEDYFYLLLLFPQIQNEFVQ